MSSTTGTNAEAAAASRPQRGGSNVVVESNKGVRAAAKRFRQCFPGVQNKKRKGWRWRPTLVLQRSGGGASRRGDTSLQTFRDTGG